MIGQWLLVNSEQFEMAFKFEDLRVWQKSLDFATEVSILVRNFPSEERYVLTSQFQRAADSVALNIAEGSTGQTPKEFKRFLGIALRSAIECVACIHLARRRNLISEEEFSKYYQDLEELIKMLQALRKSIH